MSSNLEHDLDSHPPTGPVSSDNIKPIPDINIVFALGAIASGHVGQIEDPEVLNGVREK